MFARFGTGLRLAKASWRVLKADRSLAIFPVLSAISALVAIWLILSPWWLGLDAGSAAGADGASSTGSALDWVLALVAGYVATAISIYFNVALASCASRSLQGVDTTVREGLAVANSRIPQVLGWALIAFAVGLVLRALDELADQAPFPLSLIANIGVAVLGMAWGAVTFLVIPALALEQVGPREAFSRSKELIIQRWGEGLAGNAGIGLAVFLCGVLPSLLVIALGGWMMSTGTIAAGFVVLALGVVGVVVAAVVSSALSQIFAVTLYRFASDGQLAPGFDPSDIQLAFRRRAA